jgi:acyl-CoA synthetase (AMP-forming)/AMP-acid ligase II
VSRVCIGTAPLPLSLKKAFEAKYGVELFESYGLSELLFVTATSPFAARDEGSVGTALPGVAIEIRDEQGTPLAGAEGEIHVKTPFLTPGYIDYDSGRPETIPADSWFPTGDVGRLGADGQLFVTSRKKDLIIRGGVNVSPRAVEDVLLEHPAIEEAVAIGVPDEFYGETIVAVLILKAGRTLAAEEESLERLCRDRLSAAARPSRFMTVDGFPRSTAGKIQKNRVRDDVMSTIAASGTAGLTPGAR